MLGCLLISGGDASCDVASLYRDVLLRSDCTCLIVLSEVAVPVTGGAVVLISLLERLLWSVRLCFLTFSAAGWSLGMSWRITAEFSGLSIKLPRHCQS